ncbi:uncharacterized protein C21orf62 homolog isoform X1 [Pantherophis guttatus]|uniref:Uncharacterized protein C21orf62 homolog isoform X1 n=1 Tax=Pantherophis guttatus TaxID=94885 RepID=A0ABM3Z1Y3_PANGU|nr:uncharacterized protein C21orf62 homolog isoform X1 [Pantherophis guttatus]
MWGMEKLCRYKDIVDGGGNLKSNDTLRDQGTTLDWWTYLQIKSRYQKDKDEYGLELGNNGLDKILMGPGKKALAKLYNYLLDEDRAEDTIRNQLRAWESNIGHSLNFNEWEEAWNKNYKLTRAATYKENHYKMLHRWHLAPARLAKMFPNVHPNCWKCGHGQGTFFHMWWTCPEAKRYWSKIRRWLKDIIKEEIDLNPEIFLLGMVKKGHGKEKVHLLIHITTAARLAYAQYWKKKDLPPDDLIISKILECTEISKLTHEINDDENSDYDTVWGRWYEWINDRIKEGVKGVEIN